VCNTLPWWGSQSARIALVIDPRIVRGDIISTKVPPLTTEHLGFLAGHFRLAGVKKDNLIIFSACMPVTEDTWGRDSLMNKQLKADRGELITALKELKPKLIICMGKSAATQISGRPVQITKIRGTPYYDDDLQSLVLPTLGLYHIIKQPEVVDLFKLDVSTVKRIISSKFSKKVERQVADKKYQWVSDLEFLIKREPRELTIDTEGVGLRWYDPAYKLLTVQLCTEPGEVYCVPIDYNPFFSGTIGVMPDNECKPNRPVDVTLKQKLIRQLNVLLNEMNIKCTGHNLKFDIHCLRAKGIKLINFDHCTQVLTHHVDENMRRKGLADCARRWCPRWRDTPILWIVIPSMSARRGWIWCHRR
jgi:hypothetical protein